MRILFLTPQLPYPPHQGTTMRNWGLISGIAKNHEVWLLSFDDSQIDMHTLEPLKAACVNIVTFPVPRRRTQDRLRTLITSSIPDMGWRLWSPAFAKQLDQWLSQHHFDIVQVEGIEMARYMMLASKPPHTRFIFDDHNCEYILQQRNCLTDLRKPQRWHAAAYSLLQWQRLRDFELAATRAAHATLCVSPQDAATLRQLNPALTAHVIPNGIDLASYAVARPPTSADTPAQTRPPTLIFTGKMDYRPNIEAVLWFADEVLPLVQQSVPNVQFQIVGQKPSARLDKLRSNPNIVITGAVDDIRGYIANADVYVAPLRVGGGTRFKLLEAMALQCPIVTTHAGCEGFELQHGDSAYIADPPADFAAAVCDLLRNPNTRGHISHNALAFAAAYDWGNIVPKLEEIMKDEG